MHSHACQLVLTFTVRISQLKMILHIYLFSTHAESCSLRKSSKINHFSTSKISGVFRQLCDERFSHDPKLLGESFHNNRSGFFYIRIRRSWLCPTGSSFCQTTMLSKMTLCQRLLCHLANVYN
jgi:hypothetical protein